MYTRLMAISDTIAALAFMVSGMLVTIVSRYPHTSNYPFPIIEANAERQYRLARELMSMMRVTLS